MARLFLHISIFASAFLGLVFAASASLAAPPPLSVYGKLPQTEALDLSPNGELFARISTEGEKRFLVVEKVSGGLVMTAEVGDLKVAALEWANDNLVLVYLHTTAALTPYHDPQEFLQAFVADVKQKKIRLLLPGSTSYLSAIFGRYGYAEIDGDWYGFFGVVPTSPSADPMDHSGFFKQGYPDLYRVDLVSGAVRKIANGGENRLRWVLDEQGQVLAYSEYDGHSRAWRIYRSGSSTPVASGHDDFGFGIDNRGRTPRTVTFADPGNKYELTELNLDDGSRTVITDLPVRELIEAPNGQLLIGMTMEGEIGKTVMFDPVMARRMDAIARGFPGDSLHVTTISADRSKIVVYVEGSHTGGTWQLVDFATGKATPLADAYPAIPEDMLGTVRVMDYRAGDGLEISAILTLPPGRQGNNLPLVVMPHGGPEAMDHVGFDYEAQAFAARGYAVFQPNFRGSSGHGTAFRDAGFGQWGRRMQTDISDGVAALAQQGIIDPSRVCIVGGSYGGYAALAGVTLQHGLYKCAAAYGGVSDPASAVIYSALRANDRHPVERYWRSYMVGANDSSSRIPDEISPLAHAAEADAPVLLIHGKDDTVVQIDQSERMESALRHAGKPVELVELKSEDHWLSRSATRLQTLEAIVSFVEKYNPPEGTH